MKTLRLIKDIITYPFKIRRSYYGLATAAKLREDQKRMEREE